MSTDFQTFCTVGERMKFATKRTRHYPPHLMRVATLPWEIKNGNFCRYSAHMEENTKCIFIAFTFVIHPQIRYFQCLK